MVWVLLAFLDPNVLVIVDYNQLPGSQYSLLDVDNYEFVSYRKGTTRRKYTFTDADYQFALENGTKLENK